MIDFSFDREFKLKDIFSFTKHFIFQKWSSIALLMGVTWLPLNILRTFFAWEFTRGVYSTETSNFVYSTINLVNSLLNILVFIGTAYIVDCWTRSENGA